MKRFEIGLFVKSRNKHSWKFIILKAKTINEECKNYQRRMQKLLNKSRETKEGLVKSHSYEINLWDIANIQVLEEMDAIELTRNRMYLLLGPLTKRTIDVIDNTIKKRNYRKKTSIEFSWSPVLLNYHAFIQL